MNLAEFSWSQKLKASGYKTDEKGIFRSGREGYWSNLDKEDNDAFLDLLEELGPRRAVLQFIPQFEDIIFSPSREGVLELLDIKEGDIGVDYGCMWGVLSIGMAKRGAKVIAVDQTLSSLRFLSKRAKAEDLNDIVCVQDDIREVQFSQLADIAVVNGVLEWIPEVGDIELNKYYGKKVAKDYAEQNPQKAQSLFLKQVNECLKGEGRLMLAIENRFDYTHFFGKPDPHSNLLFTAILPRKLANLISRYRLGRSYVNYIYSFPKIKKMILDAGFKKVELYMAFPDYRYPAMILPYKNGIQRYQQYWQWGKVSWKRRFAYAIEYVLMKFLGARFFAPSIIAIAKK